MHFFNDPSKAIHLQLPWEKQEQVPSPEAASEELLDELADLYHKLIEDKKE